MHLTPSTLTVLLALASAFLFALSDQVTHRAMKRADARSGAVVSVAATALVFWLAAPWLLRTEWWLTSAAAVFALIGLVRPALSIYLAMRGIGYLGPTLASAFSATTPLWGGALAILILGEHLTPPIALGTLAVIAGAVIASFRTQGLVRHWPLWALLFPLGAAFIRSSAHVGTKIGYQELPNSYFASLVSMSVSAVIGALFFRLQGQRMAGATDFASWIGTYRLFIVAGLLNGLSVYAQNTALEHGSIVTVVPIMSTGPVFTLLLGLLVFRSESITWRTVATIALIVPGVILVIAR